MTQREFRLTGRHVLLSLVAFFAVMLAANAVFVMYALESFPGESQKKSYLQGLNYNDTLAKRDAQAALGWRVEVSQVSTDVVEVRFYDRRGEPLSGLSVNGVVGRPASQAEDQEVTFVEGENGAYRASGVILTAGAWDLAGDALNPSGRAFEFRSRVIVE